MDNLRPNRGKGFERPVPRTRARIIRGGDIGSETDFVIIRPNGGDVVARLPAWECLPLVWPIVVVCQDPNGGRARVTSMNGPLSIAGVTDTVELENGEAVTLRKETASGSGETVWALSGYGMLSPLAPSSPSSSPGAFGEATSATESIAVAGAFALVTGLTPSIEKGAPFLRFGNPNADAWTIGRRGAQIYTVRASAVFELGAGGDTVRFAIFVNGVEAARRSLQWNAAADPAFFDVTAKLSLAAADVVDFRVASTQNPDTVELEDIVFELSPEGV